MAVSMMQKETIVLLVIRCNLALMHHDHASFHFPAAMHHKKLRLLHHFQKNRRHHLVHAHICGQNRTSWQCLPICSHAQQQERPAGDLLQHSISLSECPDLPAAVH
jgi:hypothetical protein